MIEVEDDGRGIDEAALVEKAVESGKIARSEASELVRDEILALIFVPGLSTREQVDGLVGSRCRHGHRQDQHSANWAA